MRQKKNVQYAVKYGLLVLSVCFMGIGLMREEHKVVLKKAIHICLECIGVG
jgi:hypothetical protein